jgi:AraC-like DNA-binding protein
LAHRLFPFIERTVSVTWCRNWAACFRQVPECDAVVVAVEDPRRHLPGLAALEEAGDRPVVLCVPAAIEVLRALARVRVDDVVLLGSEEALLPRLLLERCGAGALGKVAEALSGRVSDNPVLARAIRLIWEQRPPLLNDAQALMARGETVFVRSVKEVSDWVGCHPDYLSRQARAYGISMSATIRWLTTLRGVSLYNPPWATWHEVAARLGFEDPAAWTHFVRRLTGATPSQLVDRPWAELVERALRSL